MYGVGINWSWRRLPHAVYRIPTLCCVHESCICMQIIVYSAEVDGGGGGGGGEMGVEEGGVDSLTDMYDNLPPLEKLERYFQSEDVLDRYGTYRVCK